MFEGIYARGAAARETSARAWLRAMLDAEAALARACAAEELITLSAADAITAACAEPAGFDAEALSVAAAAHASPVVPLVAALKAAVAPDVAASVHLGATSQDILDTAAMLVSVRALTPILEDGAAAQRAAASLAARHRETAMAGRTLLQDALPVSFGLRAAGWASGLGGAVGRLQAVREHELPAQMGGPVGSRDPAIAQRVAADLGLAEPLIAWHTIRLPPAALAGALGALAGVLAKIARDVTLLAQNALGEVAEGSSGGSSAMAHKQNPVASVSILACTRRVPGLVATLLACMEQEHERAAGGWQAEWGTLSDLLTLTGSATAWTRDLLEHLHVDAARMRENLKRLAADGVEAAATPGAHLGAASELIDRALEGLPR